jgi:methionyl-tRNA formyltransferase
MEFLLTITKRMNIIAVSNKLYDDAEFFKKENIAYIKNKSDLTYTNIMRYSPDYIFFPHWSYIIDREIYENFNCVIFHMTDVPFGRGGSPLQNLLERKIYQTKISAIKCVRELDAGDVYLKRDFDISYGNAEEIYARGAGIISEMIDEIIFKNPKPIPQHGEVVEFKRRSPAQSDISQLRDLESVYNYVRMLDAPGYPKAFIECNQIKYIFYGIRRKEGMLQAQLDIVPPPPP